VIQLVETVDGPMDVYAPYRTARRERDRQGGLAGKSDTIDSTNSRKVFAAPRSMDLLERAYFGTTPDEAPPSSQRLRSGVRDLAAADS